MTVKIRKQSMRNLLDEIEQMRIQCFHAQSSIQSVATRLKEIKESVEDQMKPVTVKSTVFNKKHLKGKTTKTVMKQKELRF